MQEPIQWVDNHMPPSEDKNLPIMSLNNVIMSGYHGVDGVFPTVDDALDAALEERDDMNVLVTGSFRTAEDALRWLQSRYARS